MKSIHIVPFLFIFLVATAFGANDEGIASNVKVPKTVTFLPMPVGSRVRVVTGVLEELGAGGYAASNLPVSIQRLLNTGKPVEMILGTPALVTTTITESQPLPQLLTTALSPFSKIGFAAAPV
jgi:hypothetical protein